MEKKPRMLFFIIVVAISKWLHFTFHLLGDFGNVGKIKDFYLWSKQYFLDKWVGAV